MVLELCGPTIENRLLWGQLSDHSAFAKQILKKKEKKKILG